MSSVGSNSGKWFDMFWDGLGHMVSGKDTVSSLGKSRDANFLERGAKYFGGEEELKKFMQPLHRRGDIQEEFYGKTGHITKAEKALSDASERLSMEQDVNKQNAIRKEIENHNKTIASHKENYDNRINPKVGQGARLVDAYGPGNMKNFVNFMNAGTKSQVATKYGIAGGAYFGTMGAIRGMTGGGMTYNSSGESDIAGIPFI